MEKGNISISFECKAYVKGCMDDADTVSVCWGPYVLAAVSENKDYITIPKSDINKLQHNGGLEFSLDEFVFKPLNKISDECYHLYIKLI